MPGPGRRRPVSRLSIKTVAGLGRLVRRREYLFIAKGVKAVRPCLVAQARVLPGAPARPVCGFTTTKKIGNAVVRNRARRRLKEAARQLLPEHGRPGVGYVFIARDDTAAATWPRLLDDMKSALIRLAEQLEAGERAADGAGEPAAKYAASAQTPKQTDEPC